MASRTPTDGICLTTTGHGDCRCQAAYRTGWDLANEGTDRLGHDERSKDHHKGSFGQLHFAALSNARVSRIWWFRRLTSISGR